MDWDSLLPIRVIYGSCWLHTFESMLYDFMHPECIFSDSLSLRPIYALRLPIKF